MANLNDIQDPTGGQIAEDRSVMPPGEYQSALVKSARVESKNKPGNYYLDCEYQVIDGPYTNRRFWQMFNLWNSNDQAVEIANRDFNSLKNACGKLNVGDSEELHGIPVIAKLKIKKGNNGYQDKNEVVIFKPLNGSAAQQPSGGQQSDQGGNSAPWKRTG